MIGNQEGHEVQGNSSVSMGPQRLLSNRASETIPDLYSNLNNPSLLIQKSHQNAKKRGGRAQWFKGRVQDLAFDF